MDIQQILDSYIAQLDKLEDTTNKLFNGESKQFQSGIIPNYLEEVIIPVVRLLDLASPNLNIKYPEGISGGFYKLYIKNTLIGGFCSVCRKNKDLVFITPWHGSLQGGTEYNIKSINQLSEIINKQFPE